MRTILAGLTDLLYPRLCVECGGRNDRRIHPLCPDCASGLTSADPRVIRRRLGAGATEPGPLAWAAAGWTYEPTSPLRSVLHTLKYGARPELGVRIGRILGAHLGPDIHSFSGAARLRLVPVPLGRLRLLERGYNQSERIGLGLARAGLGTTEDRLLVRHRETRPQAGRTGRSRWENVAEAFSVTNADPIPAGPVLLVDDVCTTGATLLAAAGALARAGGGPVGALACGLVRREIR